MDEEKKDQIKLEVKEEDLDNFTFLHEILGSRYKSDTIRYCINATYDAYHQAQDEIQIDPATLEEIKKLLKHPSVQNKLLLSTINQFVHKALELLIENIRKENREIGNTVWNWEFLSNIPQEDRDILIALVQCQKQNRSNLVTSEHIAKTLNRRNLQQIQETLEKYVNMGMLEQINSGEDFMYHAPNNEDLLNYEV